MKVIKETIPSPLINESDEDLLIIISMKEEPESSNLAFAEFHNRYKRFIYGMATSVTLHLPNSEELRDIVFQNTLINVYRYCDSFSLDGESNPEIIKKRIHGWLVKIAKTELLALLCNRQSIIDPSEVNMKFDFGIEIDADTDTQIPYNEYIVGEALKVLKDRDQHVFMTYWLYYEQGEASQAKNLPQDILNELAEKYETTPENIRQIISRSKKKVNEFLKANYKFNRK